MRLTSVLFLAMALATLAAPQSPQFEVATVKLNPIGHNGPVGVVNGRYRATGLTLHELLAIAYEMATDRVSGPASMKAKYFDIDAVLPENASAKQVPLMLQELLAKRFRVVLHKEKKETDVFKMIAAKGGLKLPSPPPTRPARGITAGGTGDMRQLAIELSGGAGRPILDGTGKEGSFFYYVEFDPRPNSPTGLPDFLTAVEEQLGIKLQSSRAVVDFIVVDSAETSPTEN